MKIPLSALIRAESPADITAIRQVHESAFPTPGEGQLVDALRSAGHLCLSLVAEFQGTIIGHVACSPVSLRDHPSLLSGVGLGPIAIIPAHQSQGVGSRLMRDCLAAAAAGGFTFIVVLGEQAYYTRFGFVPGSNFGLQNEYGVGDEFMALELQFGSLPQPAGLVRYAPEFASVAP
ncbi:MAG: N-acetyltransferase [Planctomycetes bacterium]|nr:N-acetyltransferase [Planctomycetota bacterium]